MAISNSSTGKVKVKITKAGQIPLQAELFLNCEVKVKFEKIFNYRTESTHEILNFLVQGMEMWKKHQPVRVLEVKQEIYFVFPLTVKENEKSNKIFTEGLKSIFM